MQNQKINQKEGKGIDKVIGVKSIMIVENGGRLWGSKPGGGYV